MNEILSEFYICSCENDGGMYRFVFTDDENLICTQKIDIPNPLWAEVTEEKLCVCALGKNWESGKTDNSEGYAEFSLASGELIGDITPLDSNEVCHLCITNDKVYLASYGDGSIITKMPDGTLQKLTHKASEAIPLGKNIERQERPHAHHCLLSPDGKFLLVCDLGLDCVFVYDLDLKLISYAKIPCSHGARHSVFSKDGKKVYILGEMGTSVTEFLWDNGYLTPKNTVSIRVQDKITADGAAAIRLSSDGEHLYCTDRGENMIAHLTTSEGLKLISQTQCGGIHPRDFTLISNGKYGVCCNRFSNNIALFRINNEHELEFIRSYDIPSPVCVSEIK